jgi:hypothetical protein
MADRPFKVGHVKPRGAAFWGTKATMSSFLNEDLGIVTIFL